VQFVSRSVTALSALALYVQSLESEIASRRTLLEGLQASHVVDVKELSQRANAIAKKKKIMDQREKIVMRNDKILKDRVRKLAILMEKRQSSQWTPEDEAWRTSIVEQEEKLSLWQQDIETYKTWLASSEEDERHIVEKHPPYSIEDKLWLEQWLPLLTESTRALQLQMDRLKGLEDEITEESNRI